ncbi:hypothetical protein SVIOM74S_01425 [Streptomyces violarus]
MARRRSGGTGPLRKEDRRVGRQGRDVAQQVPGQVRAVRGQVAQHAAAAPLPLVAPCQRALGMGRVVAEQPEADMRDRADLARGDQLTGGLDGGRVAVVEADGALHTRLGHRVRHRTGVLGGQTHRLLDPDVLARLGHGDADLAVQEVRRGDADRLHPGVGDHVAPVTRGRGEPELPGGLLGPARHLLGDRDQLRNEGQLRIVVPHARVRLGVHPPHPAETDDGDAERVHHESPSLDRSRTCPAHPERGFPGLSTL